MYLLYIHTHMIVFQLIFESLVLGVKHNKGRSFDIERRAMSTKKMQSKTVRVPFLMSCTTPLSLEICGAMFSWIPVLGTSFDNGAGRGLNNIPQKKKEDCRTSSRNASLSPPHNQEEMLCNKTTVITSNNLPKEIEFQKKEIVHWLLLPYRELKMISTLKSNQE